MKGGSNLAGGDRATLTNLKDDGPLVLGPHGLSGLRTGVQGAVEAEVHGQDFLFLTRCCSEF